MKLQDVHSAGSGRELFIGRVAVSVGSPTYGAAIVSAWNKVMPFAFAVEDAVLH
jgi:hypothetical protein